MFLFKRKPKPVAEDVTIAEADAPAGIIEADPIEPAEEREPVRRVKQQNIKASEDCCLAFDAIAKALDMSKAQLFEDMVAERLDMLRRQGTDVEASAG
ncbi:MAG: hypothetical protein WCF79_02580 [Rhodomicrobium sp.]